MSSFDPLENNKNYQKIAKLIHYLNAHQQQQPSLQELSAVAELSEFHLQRLFSQWVGLSPKQYLKFLTKEYAKRQLQEQSVFESSLASGLSGSSRLHDLMLSCEGLTPGEYKKQAKGICIDYGVLSSPFGQCLVAATAKGVCKLGFFDNDSQYDQLLQELASDWALASLRYKQSVIDELGYKIFPIKRVGMNIKPVSLQLYLKGSPFQIQVWEALLSIPDARISSYASVAKMIHQPTATRAVASAIAKNPIGLLIPCHRVIRSNGDISQYRWGGVRKQAMLGWEASQCVDT